MQESLAGALRCVESEWSEELLARVVPGGLLDAAAALSVYRGCYIARLTEQLGEAFGAVWRVLGDADFFAACEIYIADHPSTSYNLSDYGRDFPAFLSSSPLAEGLPFLTELASFELEFHDLFHAAVPPGGDSSQAAELAARGDLSGARLEFSPALRLLALGHAVHDLFAHRVDAGPLSIDVARPQWMMLYRHGTEVMALEVGAGTFAALRALVAGETVDEALDRALGCEAGFDEKDAQRLFEILVASGVVTRWML